VGRALQKERKKGYVAATSLLKEGTTYKGQCAPTPHPKGAIIRKGKIQQVLSTISERNRCSPSLLETQKTEKGEGEGRK